MKSIFAMSIALAAAALVPAGAQARNYDCAKAGNATKAACKSPATAAKPAVQRAAPATVARPALTRSAATRPAATRPIAARAGAPGAAWTTKTGKVVHYDCAKAGNQTKQACKG